MKFSTTVLLGFMLMTLPFCHTPVKPQVFHETKREMVERLERETIALVRPQRLDDHLGIVPYCTGVWVEQTKILTARHCVDDEPMLIYAVYDDDENLRVAHLVAEDPENDLALLTTDPQGTPNHPITKLANEVWVGEHVNIIGHTTGLWWTYIEGVISSSRKSEEGKKSALQISSPAWFGNSGGGAFDDEGNLVGISSWVSTRAPMMSFFIHRSVIEKFLKENSKQSKP